MAEANIKVTVCAEFTLTETELLCNVLKDVREGEGTEYRQLRERLHSVLIQALHEGHKRI